MKYLRRIAFVDLRPSVKEGFSALRRKNLHTAIFPEAVWCAVSVFYQCRFCGICFSFQRYFCHGRIVSNHLRRFGIGSVSQVRIQKEEILSPRIFEKKIHESARVERSAERWRRAKERSDEGWRLRHGMRGKRNAIRHDSRITSFISG